MSLPTEMAIGMVLGIIVGALPPMIGFNPSYCQPIGQLFINLVRMVVVPLVLTTLIAGAASVCDVSRLGLMAYTVSMHGLSVLLPLITLVAVMYVACLLQILIVYLPCVKFAGLSPSQFLKGLSPSMMIAFTTCSSAAALSTTLLKDGGPVLDKPPAQWQMSFQSIVDIFSTTERRPRRRSHTYRRQP